MTEVPADELRGLLAEPLDRFIAVRTERVKALRSAGRREEAALLATVRKPSRLAARVVALARVDPDAAAGAVQAAEDLEAAQIGDGDLREAMGALRPAIDAVLAAASIVDRVDLAVPLRTVLADVDAREAWLEGLLVELPGLSDAPDPVPSGPRLTLVPTGPHVVPGRRSASTPAAKGERQAEAKAAARAEAARRAAEQREEARRALQAEFDEAVGATDAATIELQQAEAARIEAEDRAADARRVLTDAEADLASAAADADDAERRLGARRQALDRARTALDDH